MPGTQGQADSGGSLLSLQLQLHSGTSGNIPWKPGAHSRLKRWERNVFKTHPWVISLKVCSKHVNKGAEVSSLALKRSTLLPSKHGRGVCHKASAPAPFVFSKASLITKLFINNLPPDWKMWGFLVNCSQYF